MAAAAFKVLVSDDTKEWLQIAEEQLTNIPGIELRTTSTPEETIAAIDEDVYHLAFIDLEQCGSAAGGREILHHLRRCAPSCRRLVTTRFLEKYASDLVALAAPTIGAASTLQVAEPLVHGIIDKGRTNANFFEHYTLPAVESWRERGFEVPGRDVIEQAIQNRRNRIPNLRSTPAAISDELEILMRRIFGVSIGIAGQDRLSRVEANLFTEGFSSAVVFSATPQVGVDISGAPIRGNACVVKVGPVGEIAEESYRFDKVVRYGVAQEHRVEMLAVAYADALGAICYSFAGGSSSAPRSLDEVLQSDDAATASATFDALFRPSSKSWYSVVTPKINLSDYFRQEYHFQVGEGIERIAAWSKKRTRSGKSSAFLSTDGENLSLAGTRIALPRSDIAGHPALLRRKPSCLIHGDMHGGNVMIERDRISMIDYRQAGAGPRLLDIASLQCTVRLHDPAATGEISSEDVVSKIGRRVFRDEVVIKDALVADNQSSPSLETWEKLALQLNAAMASNFSNDWDAQEYLGSHLMVALRVASIAHIGDARRLRLLCWIHALVKELDRY